MGKKIAKGKRSPKSTLVNYQISPHHIDYDKFKVENSAFQWCPLFGEMPSHEHGSLEEHSVSDSLNVIRDARKLWYAHDREEYKRELYREPPEEEEPYDFDICPKSTDLIFYPTSKLSFARAFLTLWYRRLQYDLIFLEQPRGPLEHLPNEKVLDFMKRYISINDISPAELFSLIALSISWLTLRDILIAGLHPNSPDILSQVKKARSLIERAKDEYIEKADPGIVEAALKHKKGSREGGKAKGESYKSLYAKLQRKADDIYKRNEGKISKNAIAACIQRELKQEYNQALSVDRISRIIKLPSEK